MANPTFDAFADAYESMIDWPKRLANEAGLFRSIFESVGARRVLDAACGTGHHAAMFHSWGLEVEGADLSPAMIERCRALHGQPDRLRWTVRGYDQPVSSPGAFDVAICIGNSLALAPDRETIDRAIAQLLAAVRAGGAVVVHVLNLWKLPDGPPVWQKCQRATLAGKESLIIKGVQRVGDRGRVHLLITDLSAPTPALRSDSALFWGLTSEQLTRSAVNAGGRSLDIFGDYQRSAYRADASSDLILVAHR